MCNLIASSVLGCECREDYHRRYGCRTGFNSLMKNISMVFQSVYLFADTIENNIKFIDATYEQVVEAHEEGCQP